MAITLRLSKKEEELLEITMEALKISTKQAAFEEMLRNYLVLIAEKQKLEKDVFTLKLKNRQLTEAALDFLEAQKRLKQLCDG